MKKILFTSLAVLGLGITGCSNEDLGVAKSGVDEVCATMGDAESRTAMNGNSVVWSTGDAIGIFVTNGSSSTYTNANYSLSNGAGTKNAEFSGVLEGDNPVKKAAFYPYGSDASYDGSKISLTLKDTYNYKEGENSSALMACQINESTQDVLAFKNAGALMSVTVNNIPTDYIWAKLTSMTAQEKTTVPTIAGNAQIAFAEGIPTLTTTETSNSSSITINFTASNDVTSKTFYFPLPVAEYPALELSIGNGSTSQVLKTKALDAKRNERYTTTITLDEVSGSVPTTVESVSAVADALATTNSVSVTDVAPTEASPTVSIPKKNTPAENVSISFENISTTATVAIKEASTGASGNSAPENVLVSVPQLDTAPKFEIELPSSTVTLAANGETATYDEVTATTAANTLVLDKGITVNTLKVKAGNVRVKSGAKVTAISRESGNTSTVIIYKEEGAELPNLSGNDAFEVVDAAVADLQNVAKNGGTYTLATDLTGDFTISATKEVIINLNGHKITNKSGDTFTVNKDSKLTINGNGTVDNVSHGKTCIYNNGTVILNDGTYIRSKENGQSSESSGGNSYYNILNHGEMTINPNVEISQNGHYSSMIANGYYDYTNTNPRNGYVSGTNHQNPSLIINGGTFAGGLNTIKNDDGAQLVINDGTFTNMSQATVQNHHVAEIKGGTFNTTGSAQYVVDNEGHNGAANDLGQMTISGGTLNGKIYVVGAGASLAVTGGTFSDPSALAYLGDNADITVKLDTDTRLAKTMIVEKGAATIDLNNHRLTADASATIKIKENGDDVVVAVAVKDGAKVMVKNGNIGDSSNKLSYGVYAFGKADVTLNNVGFSEMVIYAYNGAGKLAATDCIFKGWLSGWHHGGTFAGCTFTIGKAWYPAAICYGSTTFTNCKFFKNEVDADVYDDDNKADSDGYYRCCYVVAQCNPSNSIGFTNCKFIDESNTETGSVAIDNHPFHACGWGNGTAANYNVTVDNAVVTSQCSDKTKTSNENK